MMSFFLVILFTGGTVFFLCSAQYFHDPKITFQNITFDHTLRGTFNMSHCSKSMINCWEIVKPDVICSYEKHYESICGQIREYCEDTHGDQYRYWHMYQVREAYCNTVSFLWGSYEAYTRRRRPARRRTPARARLPATKHITMTDTTAATKLLTGIST